MTPILLVAAERSDVPSYLKFVSTLIWQILVIAVLIYYRRDLGDLLRNISKFKLFGVEGEVQKPVTQAPAVASEATKKLAAVESGGFLTANGIGQIIEASGLLDPGEKIEEALLIFSTGKQHTWIVATSSKLFCLLDDEKERTNGTVIQWFLPKKDAAPVQASPYKRTIGLLQIGPRKDWLYSTRLFPSPTALERRIKSML